MFSDILPAKFYDIFKFLSHDNEDQSASNRISPSQSDRNFFEKNIPVKFL